MGFIRKLERKYDQMIRRHRETSQNESRLVRSIKNTVFDATTILTLGPGGYLLSQGFDQSDMGKIALGALLGMAGLKIFRYSIRRGFRHKSKY